MSPHEAYLTSGVVLFVIAIVLGLVLTRRLKKTHGDLRNAEEKLMALTTAQRQFVVDQLKATHVHQRTCAACGKGHFTLGTVAELREYTEGVFCGGASIVPVAIVTCDACGAAYLYNAIKVGLVDPDTGRFIPR